MRGISSREALLSTWPIASRSAIFRRPRPQTGCWAISKADLSSAQSKNLFILSDEEISSAVFGGPKTAEEISSSDRMNKFFDWAEDKSAFEIAQHPVWGRGRRKIAEREAIGQVLSSASRDEMPLIWRYTQ